MNIEIGERQAWLAKRRKYIGASDSAAAIGCSPWKSRYSLWAEKTGRIEPDDLSGNEAVLWGNLLEPAIRREVGNRMGATVMHDGEFEILTCESHPFMSCTLDGMIVATQEVCELFEDAGMSKPDENSTGTVQIKTSGAWNKSEWEPEKWDLHYQVQTQHELVVSGFEWGLLAVLIGGQELRILPFHINERFCKGLISGLREFWDMVQSGEPPEVDGSDSTMAALKKLYPKDDGEVVTMPSGAILWDKQLCEAKQAIKDAKLKESEAKAKLIESIGSATCGEILGGGCEYTYKAQTARHIDAKALRAKYPEVAEACTNVSTSRVLRRRAIKTG